MHKRIAKHYIRVANLTLSARYIDYMANVSTVINYSHSWQSGQEESHAESIFVRGSNRKHAAMRYYL